MNNVKIVYTPSSNIKKTADMDVGQVGFHKSREVRLLNKSEACSTINGFTKFCINIKLTADIHILY